MYKCALVGINFKQSDSIASKRDNFFIFKAKEENVDISERNEDNAENEEILPVCGVQFFF